MTSETIYKAQVKTERTLQSTKPEQHHATGKYIGAIETPCVYIIVLNWQQYELTAACIRSLMKLTYPNYRVVVVDNGSEDDSVEKLSAEFDNKIDVIENHANLGFCGGNNAGINYALTQQADYVMLLNNDTIVEPEFVEPLLNRFQSTLQVGVVTPKICYLAEPKRIWAAGGYIQMWLGTAHGRGKGALDQGQYNVAEQVDYATGCCLFTSRSVIKTVGLLDEKFFAYWEDTDWSMRARQAGLEVWYEPNSKVLHVAGASTRQSSDGQRQGISPFAHYMTTRNNLWFLRRHCRGIRFLSAVASLTVRRLILYTLAFAATKQPKKIKSTWQGYFDGWRDTIHT